MMTFGNTVNALFAPDIVKEKIDALKAQMALVFNARASALSAKNSVDSMLTPYKQYASTSTVVANALVKIGEWDGLDTSYHQLKTYADTTFDTAYGAYFSFNAQKIANDVATALAELKRTAMTISSLIEKRRAAQDTFRDGVVGVAIPPFLEL